MKERAPPRVRTTHVPGNLGIPAESELRRGLLECLYGSRSCIEERAVPPRPADKPDLAIVDSPLRQKLHGHRSCATNDALVDPTRTASVNRRSLLRRRCTFPSEDLGGCVAKRFPEVW